MKEWYKSKTIIVAILMGASGIMVAFETQYPGIGWMITGKAFIDVILRVISTKELV